MQTGALGVVADLDLRVRELAKFLDCLYVGRAHVRGRDHAQSAAVLRKLAQLVDQQPQTAPFDERH